MTLDQVEDLEEIFAELTPTGWMIPEWLVYLRSVVTGSEFVTTRQCTISRIVV